MLVRPTVSIVGDLSVHELLCFFAGAAVAGFAFDWARRVENKIYTSELLYLWVEDYWLEHDKPEDTESMVVEIYNSKDWSALRIVELAKLVGCTVTWPNGSELPVLKGIK